MTISNRIIKARKKANITQKELGHRMGISEASISQYESGKRKPKYDTLQRIAAALNININELLVDGNINISTDVNPRWLELKDKLDNGTATNEEYLEYKEIFKKASSLSSNSMKSIIDTLLDYQIKSDEPIIMYYHRLNHEGRKEAVKRVRELSLINEYKQESGGKDE